MKTRYVKWEIRRYDLLYIFQYIFKLGSWCWMYKSCSHQLSTLNRVAALALYLGCGKNSSVKIIWTFIMQISQKHILNFWALNLSASGVHCVNRLSNRMLRSSSKRLGNNSFFLQTPLEQAFSEFLHIWFKYNLSNLKCLYALFFFPSKLCVQIRMESLKYVCTCMIHSLFLCVLLWNTVDN